MRKWSILLLTVSLLVLTGCAIVDTIFGSDSSGNKTGAMSPADIAGSLLSLIIPWSGTAIGAVGTIYSQIRKRKYIQALGSVARGVNEVRERKNQNGIIELDEETLMAIFAAIQDREGTRQSVRKIVHKIES